MECSYFADYDRQWIFKAATLIFQRKDEPVREKDEPARDFEKQSHLEESKYSTAPFSSGRRTLLAGMAASWAGLTGSAIAPKSLLALSATSSLSNPQPAAVPCGPVKV